MSDDLGRGLLGWPAERWQALDTLAAEATTASVVMRNLVEHRDQPDARTVRMSGADVGVVQVRHDFTYDMQDEDAADLERRIRIAAQDLAVCEDSAVIRAMDLANPQRSASLRSAEFMGAKNSLRGRGVQQGFAVVVSADALTQLESEVAGVRSGIELIERIIGTTVVQTNALPCGDGGDIHALLFQAAPAAYQMVHAYGPRLRVLGVVDGNRVNLRLEEGIAVGELMAHRAIGIQLQTGGKQKA
jgi:uncharacterized linocin/CFP29 family protein